MNKRGKSNGSLRTAALGLLAGIVVLVTADCVSYPMMGPPGLQVEAVIVSPGPGYIWIAGDWGWGGGRYYWVPGRWVRERPGHYWTQGRWERNGRHYAWRRGTWRKRR